MPCIRNATTGTSLLPACFVSAKTAKEAIERIRAKAATHVYGPSREASFGENLYLSFAEPYAQSNIPSIFITLADNITKRILAKFCIPIQTTFFPSHRQMTLILRSVSPIPEMSSPHARVSITNIDTSISSPYMLQREFLDKMVFLEFILRGFSAKHPLPFPGKVVAVLKIVKDGSEYKSEKAMMQKRFKVCF